MVGSGVLGLPLRLALLCPQKLYNNFFLLILTTQVHLSSIPFSFVGQVLMPKAHRLSPSSDGGPRT